LLKDFEYKIGLSTLKKLNHQFNVPTVKKPPPEHIASTLVAAVTISNVSSRNGPRTVQNKISLQDGTKIPRSDKQRGHLTDTGIYYELHFDGHEKLNFKALRMGPVGIDIYGSHCHSSSKMVKFLVVPNARCTSTIGHYYLDLVEKHGGKSYPSFKWCCTYFLHQVFVQATVDGGSETGELYAAHIAPRHQCMPEIPLEVAPGFVALKSTDNIPIESSWNLFTNYVGLDIKQILLMGKSLNYFNSAQPFHIDLFNWLWPKIVQVSLDDFVEYWNNHKIRTQRNKQLPSGFSPNYIYDFPDKFGLTYFGVPAPQDLVDALRENIPKNRKECYRWVSDEFEVKAWEAYYTIGAPKFVLTEGWTIFCQMLPHFTQD
ncbi:hypothetical protein C8R44DRAFT_942644, partial [Mycena epipterygia]